ncbi:MULTISPECIES: FkbM family methyltransferase [unclassified Chelatococcus]|uniref:FkbM family methyltransferase n=1 Tax=unclassified Chelatococcus TaxID=2638111 RepID=UPI001BCE157D|nr:MULTISPECIES: FkbM family methyltransferase [unclassified Chelatococcus]MBS7695780.1 FkbM family methyltransferase [Chelatococcus sp. YT9]MBX3555845.1 FkbM family methyltransferase [Chelatococcus sp.]
MTIESGRRINVFAYELIAAVGLRPPDLPTYLAEHFAQCAEDLIVAALIEARCLRLGLDPARQRYCEIGGNHPIATSATFLLNRKLGMTGVIVEANPALLDDLRAARPQDEIVHAAITDADAEIVRLAIARASELSSLDRAFVTRWPGAGGGLVVEVDVPALRINDLLAQHFASDPPIYLSIDIEGMDLQVLKDTDFGRFRPYIVQAEPSEHHISGNAQAIIDYLASQNYVLVGKTDVNLIFVDAFVFPDLPQNLQSKLELERQDRDAERAAFQERVTKAERDARVARSELAILQDRLREAQMLLGQDTR